MTYKYTQEVKSVTHAYLVKTLKALKETNRSSLVTFIYYFHF